MKCLFELRPVVQTFSGEGRPNVRPVEVTTPEEQGLGTNLGQRIDRTIDDIQLRRMPLPLAVTTKRIESCPRHFVVEWHHDNSGILQQFLEKTYRIRSEARKEYNPGFQDGHRGDRQ